VPTFCFSGLSKVPRDNQSGRIHAIADRVARDHGLDLFDLQFRRESIGWVLRIVLDRSTEVAVAPDQSNEGVTLEDCQHVSHDVSAVLDAEDAVEGRYTLEVSSPGLDRPLRSARDYQRFTGRLAKLVVTVPISGRKHFTGRLKGIDDTDVILEVGREEVYRIPLGSIVRARLEIEI